MPQPLYLSGLGKQQTALARNARSQSSSSVSGIGNNLPGNTSNLPSYITSKDTSALVFPVDLRGQPNVNIIEFTAHEKGTSGVKQHHIFFPCPANITFNDSATYNTVDLGVIGGGLSKIVQEGSFSPSKIAESIKSQIGGANASFSNAEIISAAAQSLPAPDAIKGAARLKGRALLNPNTNTTFSGNAIRSFTFGFKLIARSPEESEIVRKIHSKFRAFTYADSRSDAQSLLLAFPPTWTIRFLDGNVNENRFIPKIYSCYLVSVESSINSTTNMFHDDGAPLEVDISVSYQETRVLTRTDIDDLEADTVGANRGIDENGVPQNTTGNITLPKETSVE